MSTPAYGALLAVASEVVWGCIAVAHGVVHGIALWINGRRRWTPVPRLISTATGCAFYAAVAAGFCHTFPMGAQAVMVYTAISLGYLLASAACGRDIAVSIKG